ncbi:hypothetical protein HPB50_001130 [Hyalomma asiaticum]|uniref:Uncharacterized protein n=1 Tax=Hyalomma asiaticum TaxID=266040 RepID=A0ACB7RZL2_HYAAI|nr:hypothetical protein HPB50_001130 [Hyalomma asiaticum]
MMNTHSPRMAQLCADDEALTEEAEASGSSLSSSLMSATGAPEQHSRDKNISVEADIQGRRIVDIQHLLSSLHKVAVHVPFLCTLADMDCAAIIGHRMRKVLYIGVKNKTCAMCARTPQGATPKQHQCEKNWHGSSTSMEQSIIVEGFKNSVELHGLKYTGLIDDGDSSTYRSIIAGITV